jgi:hypothetical protein
VKLEGKWLIWDLYGIYDRMWTRFFWHRVEISGGFFVNMVGKLWFPESARNFFNGWATVSF